jgi:hypothetical protein
MEANAVGLPNVGLRKDTLHSTRFLERGSCKEAFRKILFQELSEGLLNKIWEARISIPFGVFIAFDATFRERVLSRGRDDFVLRATCLGCG